MASLRGPHGPKKATFNLVHLQIKRLIAIMDADANLESGLELQTKKVSVSGDVALLRGRQDIYQVFNSKVFNILSIRESGCQRR